MYIVVAYNDNSDAVERIFCENSDDVDNAINTLYEEGFSLDKIEVTDPDGTSWNPI